MSLSAFCDKSEPSNSNDKMKVLSKNEIVCFVSEESYNRVAPNPSFQDRLTQLISLLKKDKKKPGRMHKDVDKPLENTKVSPKSTLLKKMGALHDQILLKRSSNEENAKQRRNSENSENSDSSKSIELGEGMGLKRKQAACDVKTPGKELTADAIEPSPKPVKNIVNSFCLTEALPLQRTRLKKSRLKSAPGLDELPLLNKEQDFQVYSPSSSPSSAVTEELQFVADKNNVHIAGLIEELIPHIPQTNKESPKTTVELVLPSPTDKRAFNQSIEIVINEEARRDDEQISVHGKDQSEEFIPSYTNINSCENTERLNSSFSKCEELAQTNMLSFSVDVSVETTCGTARGNNDLPTNRNSSKVDSHLDMPVPSFKETNMSCPPAVVVSPRHNCDNDDTTNYLCTKSKQPSPICPRVCSTISTGDLSHVLRSSSSDEGTSVHSLPPLVTEEPKCNARQVSIEPSGLTEIFISQSPETSKNRPISPVTLSLPIGMQVSSEDGTNIPVTVASNDTNPGCHQNILNNSLASDIASPSPLVNQSRSKCDFSLAMPNISKDEESFELTVSSPPTAVINKLECGTALPSNNHCSMVEAPALHSPQVNKTSPKDDFHLVMPSLSDDEEELETPTPSPAVHQRSEVKQQQTNTACGEMDVESPLRNGQLYSLGLQSTTNQIASYSFTGLTSNTSIQNVGQPPVSSSYSSNFVLEEDIPIFSVKEDVPEPPEDCKTQEVKKNTIWIEGKSATVTPAPVDSKMSPLFKKSDLTMKEHATYLRLYNKYVKAYLHVKHPQLLGPQHIHELSVLESLQRRVVSEQQEFQKYLYDLALKYPQSYTYLKPAAKDYSMKKASAYRLNRSFEQKFSPVARRLISFSSRSPGAKLTFCGTVLEVGMPPRIVLPDIQSKNSSAPIVQGIKNLDQHFPRMTKKIFSGCIHHEPVSADSNMKILLIKNGIQFAMSSSVVNCLFNNHGPSYEKVWNIPVTVEMAYTDAGEHNKTIYLDKPLFEGDLLMRDYSTLYHKYALRAFVSQPKKTVRQNLRSGSKAVKKEVACDDSYMGNDPFDIFSANVESLETFGTAGCHPTLAAAKSEKVVKKSKEVFLSDDEPAAKRSKLATKDNVTAAGSGIGCGDFERPVTRSLPLTPASPEASPQRLCSHLKSKSVQESPVSPVKLPVPQTVVGTPEIPLSPSHTHPIKPQPKVKMVERKSNISLEAPSRRASTLLSPLDFILGQSLEEPEVEREDPTGYSPPTEDCSSLMYNMFTIGGKKVLIRCRSHGVLKDQGKSRQVYVVPKMEYQINNGYEQVTLKEAVKSWTSCFIRHKTNLLRVRINNFTSEILMYEELEPNKILGNSFSFQPGEAFQFLDNILNYLLRLDCGQYILSHEKGADFCAIRSQKTDLCDRNERETAPTRGQPNNASVPWIPVDPTLLTPHHLANNRIPATFLPKDFNVGNNKNDNKKKKNKNKGANNRKQGQNNKGQRQNKQKQNRNR